VVQAIYDFVPLRFFRKRVFVVRRGGTGSCGDGGGGGGGGSDETERVGDEGGGGRGGGWPSDTGKGCESPPPTLDMSR
jgi:hypothetical protein